MKVKVCLIQDSPVFFNQEATIDKMERLVKKYAREKCDLIVFPESFIPGYPRGFSFGAKVGSRSQAGRNLYATYYKNSVAMEGHAIKRLEKLASDENIYLIVGITEKQEVHGSLFCSVIYISPTSGLLGVHRKIKPTGTERTIWAESDGASLVSFNTKIGKIGGLICWENYMPLARFAMYKQGVELYVAPTADARETWTATMRHIALEGRCFVLGCNQYFTKSMLPPEYHDFVKDENEIMCRGGSIIVSPMGKIIAGPVYDSPTGLTAVLDLEDILKSKLDFDAVGHYNREDIFSLHIKDQPPIMFENTAKKD